MSRPFILGLAAAALLAVGPATAQTSVPNPLRPAPTQPKPAEQPKAEAAKPESNRAKPEAKETPAKPARERSARQKENDEIMRACGASWREEKVALQSKGETWRNYLKDCRARKKTEQKA
jgi:hypothetical protein